MLLVHGDGYRKQVRTWRHTWYMRTRKWREIERMQEKSHHQCIIWPQLPLAGQSFIWSGHKTIEMLFKISSLSRNTTTLGTYTRSITCTCTWQLFCRYSRFQKGSSVCWQMSPPLIILQRSSYLKDFSFPNRYYGLLWELTQKSLYAWTSRNHGKPQKPYC